MDTRKRPVRRVLSKHETLYYINKAESLMNVSPSGSAGDSDSMEGNSGPSSPFAPKERRKTVLINLSPDVNRKEK